MCTVMKKNSANASRCIQCGRCEKHCPQELPIRENLQKVTREMEGPLFKIASQVKRIIRL